MPTRRLCGSFVFLLGAGLLLTALPASAQSAQSIVEKMKARYQEQLKTVENYVVETTMYTSYHRRVMRDGAPALETEVKMKSQNSLFSALGGPPTTNTTEPAYYDQLSQNATRDGTGTIRGTRCHVLRVKDASKMKSNAEQMTYWVDAERYVPLRLRTMSPPQKKGGKPTEVVVNFEDYRTRKGLTLPWHTTVQMKMNMSKQQRQQMEKMMQQLKKLPESQRKAMEQQMPMSFDQMKRVLSGEPMTIEVTDVRVNEGIPEGTFN